MRFVGTAVLALIMTTSQVFAGASSSSFPNPDPDPATKSMSRYEAIKYVREGCVSSQTKLGQSQQQIDGPCNCYSTKTVAGMTKAEFQNFRDKSYFDDTTREKALANLDACKLKRPL